MIVINFPVFLTVAITVYVVFKMLLLLKKRKLIIVREVFSVLFFSYFLIVVYYTLFPLHISLDSGRTANLIPFVEIEMMLENAPIELTYWSIAINMLLFVPLGFFIPLLFRRGERFFRVLAYGIAASLTVEGLQYLLCLKRADIDDLIFNMLGVIAGYLCYKLFKFIFKLLHMRTVVYILQNKSNKSLLLTSMKLLLPMIALCSLIFLILLYDESSPGSLSVEELIKKSFPFSESKVAAETLSGKSRLILSVEGSDDESLLRLSVFSQVAGNRYYHRYSSKLQLEGEANGFHFNGIPSVEGTVKLVVFGKNSIASKLSVTYEGKEYTEDVSDKAYFIICYPDEIPIGSYVEDMEIKLQTNGNQDITSAFYNLLH